MYLPATDSRALASRRWLAVAVIGTALMACASDSAPPEARSADAFRAVQLELREGPAVLTLEAEAWRSYQPITTSAGEPLIVVARLHATALIDSALRVETLHLVHGDETWTGAAVEEQPRTSGAAGLEVVVRNGPHWATGDSVDVVARVALPGGRSALVRAPRTLIARVD